MSGRYYKIPIAAQAVYEQLRVWLDTALGLPGPRGETWFPPFSDARKNDTHIFVHLLNGHYQHEFIKPWVDQTVSTTWMIPIDAEEYFAALDIEEAQEPPEGFLVWPKPEEE